MRAATTCPATLIRLAMSCVALLYSDLYCLCIQVQLCLELLLNHPYIIDPREHEVRILHNLIPLKLVITIAFSHVLKDELCLSEGFWRHRCAKVMNHRSTNTEATGSDCSYLPYCVLH